MSKRMLSIYPVLLVLYEISVYLSNDMYLPALPSIMHDLSLSATHAQLTITMWFIGSASMPLIMGALSESFGRRMTLLTGGVIFVVSTILCALAVDEYTFFAPRIIQGAMISSMMVPGYATIHEIFDHKESVRIIALMSGVTVLAPAAGPLLGASVLMFAGWRAIFWVIGIYSTCALAGLYFYMPETVAPQKRPSLDLVMVMKSYWRVICNAEFLLFMIVLAGVFAGFISWITSGSLLVIKSMGYSHMAFGLIQAGVFVSYILGSYLVNYLLKIYEPSQILSLGLSICLVSAVSFVSVAIVFPTKFYLCVMAMMLYSLGASVCLAPLNRLIIETSNEPMGIRVALFTSGLMFCGVAGSAMASIFFNGSSISLGLIIIVSIGLAVVSGIAKAMMSKQT